jgi:hypothetical protein
MFKSPRRIVRTVSEPHSVVSPNKLESSQSVLEVASPAFRDVKRRRTSLGEALRVKTPGKVLQDCSLRLESTTNENKEPFSSASTSNLVRPDEDSKEFLTRSSTVITTSFDVVQKPWQLSDFHISKPIGQGKFGNVYMARARRKNLIPIVSDNASQLALKMIFKAQLRDASTSQNKEPVSLLLKEVRAMSVLCHDNIIRMHG